MKKVLFTVALMFGAMVASAQVSVVKEAKAMKKDPAAAAKVLEAALTNPETANDPNTWQLAGDLQKAIYDEENMKLYLPGGQADMPKMNASLLKMFEYYLKCDEVEQAGVANGTVKKAKLRKKNAEALLKVRLNLVNGGVEAFNVNNYEEAQKFFGLFVDVVDAPMFAEQAAKYFENAEIIELHHNQKKDAPSGTAVKTALMMSKARESFATGNCAEVETIQGSRGGNSYSDIHIHSVRMPGYMASQEVLFGSNGQVLKIRHDSTDRKCYMPGVILATKHVAKHNNFVYGLENIL